jgi:transposase
LGVSLASKNSITYNSNPQFVLRASAASRAWVLEAPMKLNRRKFLKLSACAAALPAAAQTAWAQGYPTQSVRIVVPVASGGLIVAASLEPGAIASEVARAAGVHTSQLYRWRRDLCERTGGAPAFAAVTVAPPALPPMAGAGTMEIEFAHGTRLRIIGAVDAALLSAAIRGLAGER